MKINVTENKVSIKEEQILNENEYNIHKIQFDFSSEYTDDLVKVALFSIDNHTYKKIISNNECDIPPEVLTQRGYSILGVYAYKTEQDTLVLRYSPSPTKISVYDGSYKADAENSEPITPSEIEQYQQILQNSLQQFQNQYNALVEETEGDIQAIENELQRKVDEGYFDGEDGFSPIAKVIQKSNGATIEIEDKNGKTTADVLNGEDGYTPQRGIDYWTEEDKQEVEEEATQQIEGKIEEYNENAAEKLNQYNQNSVQKTNDYNTNAEQKMSAYNTNATEKLSTYNSNATEKFNDYNSNAEQKETNYNTNASQKVEFFNTNASSKLSEYNSNAETKKSAYDENATQKTTSFNTNATNKLTEYNTNHTEKMNAYNSNNTQKLNAFNENATQKTEDFDEHTEEIQDNIEKLQTENARLKATLPTTGEVTGQDITLDKTAELEFKKPPLPMGNSEQDTRQGYNELKTTRQYSDTAQYGVTATTNSDGTITLNGTATTATEFKFKLDTESNELLANQNYMMTSKLLSGTASQIMIAYTLDGTVETFTSANKDLGLSSTSRSIKNIRIFINSGTTYNNAKIGVALYKGTTAKDYEPYVGGTASPNPDYPQEITNVTGDVEVVVKNKNLFNKNTVEDGKYINSAGEIQSYYAYALSDYIVVNPSTKYSYQGISAFSERLAYYDKNKNLISTDIVSAIPQYQTITTPSNCYYFRTTILKVDIDKYQFEENSISTNRVEHKEQKFTFPLGNEKLMLGDYLADDGIHHLKKQIVLNGTESWETGFHGTNSYQLRIIGIKYPPSTYDTKVFIKSSHFRGIPIANRLTSGDNVIYLDTSPTIYIRNTPFTSISYFKTWLSTNNLTIEYELVNEEITPYTAEQQQVYNLIKKALSYEEQTNISGSSGEINPIFDVEAYQSTKLILENLDSRLTLVEG